MVERQLLEAWFHSCAAGDVGPRHGDAQAVQVGGLSSERDHDRRPDARDRLDDLPRLRERIVQASAVEMTVGDDEDLRLDLPEAIDHALHAKVGRARRPHPADRGRAERGHDSFGDVRQERGDAIAGPWPEGADLILLSYVVSSYGPDVLQDVLARARAYLPPGGGLIIHDFALHEGQPGPRNAALWYFANLAISATTYPHTVESITRAMSAAGFVGVTARPHVPDITFVFMGRRAG